MDAEGLGRKLLLNPSENPAKQTVGTVSASHKVLTLQALSNSLNAGTAKRGCLGRGEALGSPPAICPPERPRPFTHYRKSKSTPFSRTGSAVFWFGLLGQAPNIASNCSCKAPLRHSRQRQATPDIISKLVTSTFWPHPNRPSNTMHCKTVAYLFQNILACICNCVWHHKGFRTN